jgi:hypothetical protein
MSEGRSWRDHPPAAETPNMDPRRGEGKTRGAARGFRSQGPEAAAFNRPPAQEGFPRTSRYGISTGRSVRRPHSFHEPS